ncbi:MAG TPA: tRNA-guanine transglycosylase DpdA, partial [Nitrospira sp.]|nr:tRNA-guanine transglycosylase DpdA [Nitrospira sp.]
SAKTSPEGTIPAINLYDGPAFRVLRAFLRAHRWPDPLSIAVLSAKYGLIGGLAQISPYDRRMTPARARELNPGVTATLHKFAVDHKRIDLILGFDYRASLSLDSPNGPRLPEHHFVEGPIGIKLNYLHSLLHRMPRQKAHHPRHVAYNRRPMYFLPDWDDFVDTGFDFSSDRFSCPQRVGRKEQHTLALMRPDRIADGVLVSLAQHLGTKGMLKRIHLNSADALAPRSVRSHFKLTQDQWAFGDCGAFSYASEETPSISVEQAVYVYNLYEFDLGASVDHIPLPEVIRDGKRVSLTDGERRQRIRLTRDNADRFISLHREKSANFIPVGVIQGVTAKDYAKQVGDYFDMGYRHLALGGLVPRSDSEILAIVQAVSQKFNELRHRPWLHLLGVFRPLLQERFRTLRVNSFDSATYFRKSWLRSDQNYLSSDGEWYAAIRVPPTTDPRTLLRLKDSGISERRIRSLEHAALRSLHRYDRGEITLRKCLNAVDAYDSLLIREEAKEKKMLDAYRRTLESKPWKTCDCNVCRDLGINVLIFRGLNRNKRRGAHNTLQLYSQLGKSR